MPRRVLMLAVLSILLPLLTPTGRPLRAAELQTLEIASMLFDFKRDQEVSFWMKNTYVSLDMIFIRSDGRIMRIAENTEPLSERLVPSGAPVRAVLEVIAGTAKKLGIAPGDQVAHPIFKGR